jgi:DNA polymerase-3 subunit alpha
LFTSEKGRPVINLPTMPPIEEWNEKQLLAFEKESLGFYITGHPLNRYEDELDKFANADTQILRDKKDGETVRLGGMVRNSKIIKTKKGDLMAFVTLEDLHGSVEVTVFSSLYTKVYNLLSDDIPILVQGQLQKDENSAKILAGEIIPIDKAEETWTASLHVKLDATRSDRKLLQKLHDVLKRHPGSCRAYMHLVNPDKTETVIALPASFNIKAGLAFTREVNGLLGYNAIETVCQPVENQPNNR